MWFILVLAFSLVLSAGLATPSWAGSPLGDSVTDYCGTYEAVGVKDPAKWMECRKEWERLRIESCDLTAPLTTAERNACIERDRARNRLEYERRTQQDHARQQAEAERRRQAELEERRVRALEEAAQAQRDAARAQEGQSWGINRPPACTTYQVAPGVIRTVCQ